MKYYANLATLVCSLACQPQEQHTAASTTSRSSTAILAPTGSTIASRFHPPAGYQRIPASHGSYASFLRSLEVKPHGAAVRLYDGSLKANQSAQAAVLDIDVGSKDLQQCADAVMRLRAEYLFATGKANQIHFNFTNGFRADFSKWAEGYRITSRGNTTAWRKTAAAAADHASLRRYLDLVYSYAGSFSLSRELQPVAWKNMQPGDILIIGGSPGHAETVMDMAVNAKGQKVFLLSQSYMPAQDIHILNNPTNSELSPWYALGEAPYTVITPEYHFSTSDLMRWR